MNEYELMMLNAASYYGKLMESRMRPGTIIPYVDRETSALVWSCRFCGNEWDVKEVPSRCRTCGAPRGK